MKKRICIIADALDEHYAGVHTYARGLIDNLLELDRENEYTFLHQAPNPFFAGRQEILVPLNRANPLDVFHRKIVRVNDALRRRKFDLVHDLFHIPPFAFRRTSSRTVVTIHDLTPVLHPTWHPRITALTHRIILPRVFRDSTHIIADSASTARDIHRLYGHLSPAVSVVPLASRVLPPPAGGPAEFPFILFVGTIEPRKNIPVLVEAYERIRKAGRPEKLVILGKQGWHCSGSLGRIRTSPFAGDIHVKGFTDSETLSWHYHHASAFVYPSLYEGFGLPVLEAMQCGCPVIASNTSSLPEIVGSAGLMAPPAQAAEFARHLLDVLSNPALAAGLSRRGRDQALSFSWRKTAGQTLDIYNAVLAAPMPVRQ